MIIKHLKPEPIFYDFIGRNGWELKYNETIEIPDNIAVTEGFQKSVANGFIEVISFDDGDYDFVVQRELTTTAGGNYYSDRFDVSSAGQTIFPLLHTPKDPNQVECVANGINQKIGLTEDYYINNNELVWNNKDFVLNPGDWLIVSYYGV